MMIGDNSPRSKDSRGWGFETIGLGPHGPQAVGSPAQRC